MRLLPRVSASQAVNGFHDIYSDGRGDKKYRLRSQKDFHTSQGVRTKTFNGIPIETQSKTGTSDLEPGFSSARTPVAINMSDRRKIAAANFEMGGHGRTFTMNDTRQGKETLTSDDRALDETQKTTVRSQKSAASYGHNSRKSNSIRSMRQSQRGSNRGSQTGGR